MSKLKQYLERTSYNEQYNSNIIFDEIEEILKTQILDKKIYERLLDLINEYGKAMENEGIYYQNL
jgi:hypothetical protein